MKIFNQGPKPNDYTVCIRWNISIRSNRVETEGEPTMLAIEAETNPRLENGKEIKVKIPVGYHIKLHTLKVLKGQSISDTVELALAKYFAQNPFPGLAHHEPVATIKTH